MQDRQVVARVTKGPQGGDNGRKDASHAIDLSDRSVKLKIWIRCASPLDLALGIAMRTQYADRHR